MTNLIKDYLCWRRERADERRLGMPEGLSSGPNPIIRALRLI